MSDLDQTLAALADPTRRGVVDLLRGQSRRAGDLAAQMHMSAPAMSRHLRILRGSGLVEEDERLADGRVRVYRIRLDPLQALHHWVAEVEALWLKELRSFKAFAEGTHPSKKAPT